MAVYTEVTEAALAAFLADYAIGAPLSLRGIAEGVENSNFLLDTTDGRYVLTLYEKRVDPAELPWFLGLMRHLAEQGVACPQPVPGRDGEALRELAGRPAAICTFLEGAWPRHVTPAHCAELGRAMASLHAAGRSYVAERPNALGPAAWAPLLDRCRDGGDAVQPGLCGELVEHLGHILHDWPNLAERDALPRGQIHADLFPDNAFFQGEHLTGLIDFYFACTDLLAYDLAISLNAWCFDADLRFVPERAAAMLTAYESLRPLTPAERAALPVLCAGGAMRFLLTRLYDWTHTPPGALVTRKDPLEYLARLRHFMGHKALPGVFAHAG
ncbi:homoserine kinase [Roseomonas gilardii]|uniref:homoserine kinase n=1 Tax=Roseomonas gilardii TaxID=257708 RepID=UPI0004834020|nr:homoserine kinase [Roseomonas gilardii]SUE43062.1 Homoserine kinase [Roseomonas gilardii subsp. rosea]